MKKAVLALVFAALVALASASATLADPGDPGLDVACSIGPPIQTGIPNPPPPNPKCPFNPN